MRTQTIVEWTRCFLAAAILFFCFSPAAEAQDTAKAPSPQSESFQDSLQSLLRQTGELRSLVEEMRAQVLDSRAETIALRRELEATRQQLATIAARAPIGSSSTSAAGQEPVEALEALQEEQQLLNAKVEDQYQTKVESASRYRVKLSGMVLMNLFGNSGVVDNLDFPSLALEAGPISARGGFGGSLRQSLLGLEVVGPEIGKARVSADVQFDFAGGFPNTPDGVTFGLPRLRTGMVHMSWPHTTLSAGQDAPFFSPLSPSSAASVAIPPLAYGGNLWTWVPQVRIEQVFAFTRKSNLLLQGGILDPLTGELPTSPFLRTAQAGEASRQPAYAARAAFSRQVSGRPLTLGIGGYESKQDWGFQRHVQAWAATSDWTIPLGGRWELSGEFFRGRAIGGLGGGIGRSVLFSGMLDDPQTFVRGLNSIGGWAQVKFQQTEKLEWNGAFGQDSARAADLRLFPQVQQSYLDPSIARNRSSFANFIYRPRSDLLLSAEYRWLRSFSIHGDPERAGQINLSMGVIF